MNRLTTDKGRNTAQMSRHLFDFARCHGDIRQGFMPFPLSAHRLHTRPPHIFMWAWNQSIRDSARQFRGMCSHAWYRESHGEENRIFCFAHRPHLLGTLPAARSRMRKEFKRGILSSFCLFRTFRTGKKYSRLLFLFL